MSKASDTSGRPHIFYILGGFPRISEMSTLNEIVGMIKRDFPVTLVSLKDMRNQKVMHDFVRQYNLYDRTHYPRYSLPRNLRFLKFILGTWRLVFSTTISFRDKWIIWAHFLHKRRSRTRLDAFVEIIRMVSISRPDLIYCHFGNIGEIAIILRRIFPIPFVTFFHGYDFSRLPFEKKSDYRELFARGDWFFANSTFAQEKMVQIGCPVEKLSMIGLPIDDGKFPFSLRESGPVIHLLGVGRLVEKKGFSYSIAAVAKVIERHPEIRYTIIGSGPLQMELESQIKMLGMEDKIIMTGVRKQEEVIRYMQSSHVFIMSSVTAITGDTEGLGMVLLEAQLTGLPVVATRHNGFVDAVADGKSGFLVPERDVDALARQITYLIEHPERWTEMGTHGRQHVLENFAEEVYMEKLLSKLTDLCQKTE